jgi:hypothetical protein
VVAYADDGYIKAKLSVTLQVLAELKTVFKADAGLELNVSRPPSFPKGQTAQAAFDMAQTIMQATPSLAHLSNDFLVDSFYPEGFIGIGVPIGTDAFVQSFVAKTCRDIIGRYPSPAGGCSPLYRYSATGSPSRISNLCWRTRVTLNS